MAITRKQTVLHLHGTDGSKIAVADLKKGEIVVEHASDGTVRFGTKNNAENAIVWFNDYDSTKKYIDAQDSALSARITTLEGMTGTTTSALQSIGKGEDGNYVTTTVTEKSSNEQKVSVAVKTRAVSGATTSDNGLTEAYDVQTYVGTVKTNLQGEIDSINKKLGGIEEGAQVNKIEKIQRNGTDLTISDKTVNITVPTKSSEISFDGTHQSGFTGTEVNTTIENIEKAINNIPAATVTGVTSGDKVLSLASKNLSATLGLTYDSKNTKIILTGIAGTEIASISASAFIKDGMLSKAELVTNPSGQTAGTYIHLVWNADAEMNDMYVNVTSLIDVYTASGDSYVSASVADNKITISATNELKTAVSNANSAVQSATGDTYVSASVANKKITVSATSNLTTAVTNANSAVQSATGDTYVSASAANKKITVTATDKLTTAVTNANSAVQTVSVNNTDVNKITATKSGTNVAFDFDNMIIDCGTF